MPSLSKMFALLVCTSLLWACGEDKTRIPYDAPGYVKGKAVHPTIKIGKPYRVMGKKYYPEYDPTYNETGLASWYGPNFHGKMTANGEKFNQWAMTAAHKTLPLPSMVRVTDLKTDRSIIVRLNDRGPFADGRIIDLSRAAAEALGVRARGLAKVRVEYLKPETEAYIAKLQLKKPKAMQQIDLAQAKIERTLQETHSYQPQREIERSQPVEQASEVPQSFAYEGTLPDATTIDVRGVKMEEIGYAEDAFSVLDDSALEAVTTRRTYAPRPLAPSVSPIQKQSGKQLYVRAGTFADQGNAQSFAERLSAVAPAEVIARQALWQVRLGPLFNYGIAREVQAKLRGLDVDDAAIIEE